MSLARNCDSVPTDLPCAGYFKYSKCGILVLPWLPLCARVWTGASLLRWDWEGGGERFVPMATPGLCQAGPNGQSPARLWCKGPGLGVVLPLDGVALLPGLLPLWQRNWTHFLGWLEQPRTGFIRMRNPSWALPALQASPPPRQTAAGVLQPGSGGCTREPWKAAGPRKLPSWGGVFERQAVQGWGGRVQVCPSTSPGESVPPRPRVTSRPAPACCGLALQKMWGVLHLLGTN